MKAMVGRVSRQAKSVSSGGVGRGLQGPGSMLVAASYIWLRVAVGRAEGVAVEGGTFGEEEAVGGADQRGEVRRWKVV